LGNDNFLAFLFSKNIIKKLKKQVKRIRALMHEKQFTDDLSALFFE
jgi:hypothetical protein